jgi:hypothetical protein
LLAVSLVARILVGIVDSLQGLKPNSLVLPTPALEARPPKD